MARTYLNGSAIARLAACSRMTANERMRAGAYGELLRRGRGVYARLDAVQERSGQQFSDEQIAAAVDGRPGRLIILEH
jgi:hypothetical protein